MHINSEMFSIVLLFSKIPHDNPIIASATLSTEASYIANLLLIPSVRMTSFNIGITVVSE